VKTIITLGRELHMHVTIEGVETAKQAAFLDSANGEQAQGIYFGRPMPASELAASILADFQKALPTPSSATAHDDRSGHLARSSAELMQPRAGKATASTSLNTIYTLL
jgi:predicted signal transduction protein with EAL and GGDEF domain